MAEIILFSNADGVALSGLTPVTGTVSAKSADYTVLDTDNIGAILMTTGAANKTVTLPTAADNAGRILTVTKVDSAAGGCILDGEGSETINGATTLTLSFQYESATIECDGTGWYIVNQLQKTTWSSSPTFVFNGSGGSVSPTIRFARRGDFVTLFLPAFSATTGTSSTKAVTSGAALDAWARPLTTTQECPLVDLVNNAATTTVQGMLRVLTTGVLELYRDASGTAFSNAASAGIGGPQCVTFYVGTGS